VGTAPDGTPRYIPLSLPREVSARFIRTHLSDAAELT